MYTVKIILISMLLLTRISFSQNINKKCDSLKTAYEEKYKEWEEIKQIMKKDSVKRLEYIGILNSNVISEIFVKDSILKSIYYKNHVRYGKLWSEYLTRKEEYLSCVGDSIAINEFERRPPPLFPYLPLTEKERKEIFDLPTIKHTKPMLLPEYRKIFDRYINENYPKKALEEGISGKVRLKLLITEEGIPTEIVIIKEKPEGYGFGEVAIQAMQKMRFKPAMQRGKAGNAIAFVIKQWIKFIPPKKHE